MTPSTREKVLGGAWMLAGAALMLTGLAALHSGDGLLHDRNPFAVQRSGYGKMLARLSESTIDRVWHLGVEQIVPHDISGIEHGESEYAYVDEEGALLDDGAFRDPLLEQAKQWFNQRKVVQLTRTNPYSLTESHLAAVKRDIEGMLLRSYRMDPTHYGVYNSYHLFLTTHDFGGGEASREHAKLVAETTIARVFEEDEDPEPWLTAAAAAMNLYLLEVEHHLVAGEPVPLDTLRTYRSRIGYCLNRFAELQRQAEERGTWENLSTERQLEIAERDNFARRTFGQFDAMIARAEAREAADEDPARAVVRSGGDEEEAPDAAPGTRPE